MTEQATLNIAVAGAGAFGRNHLRIYRELQSAAVHLAVVIDPDPVALSTLELPPTVARFTSVDDCLAAHRSRSLTLHAASVCVPTVAHHAATLAFLEAGVDVLVEKPIASTLPEADSLIAAARRHGRILQAGHLERFNPAVRAAVERIHRPMFFEAHRLSPFTPRSLDVDVILDLMIHDLDVVLSFVASPVREIRAVGLPILSGKADIANVRVEFDSGCIANFTASRVSTERVRKLRFFQPHQYLSIDYARQDLLIIDVTDAARNTAALLAADPTAGLSMAKPRVTTGEPLRLEIEAFLGSVRTRSQPIVSGEDGRAALALALQINEAIHEHAIRAGLDHF